MDTDYASQAQIPEGCLTIVGLNEEKRPLQLLQRDKQPLSI